ncbi:vesicle transport protein USE1-like isoform X1 [Mytilus edulis]
MSSRIEINFSRLLMRCENMAKERSLWDWRIEKYVVALQDQLSQIKKSSMKPGQDMLNEYTRKVEFLKGLLQAEKMPTVTEKALAAEQLPNVAKSAKGHNSVSSAELQKKTVARHQKDLREELLGPETDKLDDSGLRQRNVKTDKDIDIVIQHQHQMHEKLAEEMLQLTRNLKESIRDSGQIVREDNKKLEESVKLTDGNYVKLKKESDRLEKHTQTCSWWIWIMLVIVTLTFLSMIMFMKLFSKKL